ncbi:nuclear GTP-binding protein nug1 [Coemansia sp. RSA 2618]|nr:nuclear GTP-binding protein nug1 [Coemansia sp. RSA 2618]
MMLRNCIKVELLEDPIAPVDIIVQRCNPAALQLLYNVPAFLDTREFLIHLARQRGLLKRQGIADLIGAARIVLGDWNRGKIPYYTLPPGMTQDSVSGKTAAGDAAAAHGASRAVMVSEWAKEFDIDALLGDMDTQVLEDADTHNSANRRAIVMEGRTIAQDADMAMDASDDDESDAYSEDDSDDSEAMAEDSDAEPASTRTVHIVNLPTTRKTKNGAQATKKAPAVQTATTDADQMAEDSDNNDYDFGTYFKKPNTVAEDSESECESDSDDEL